MRRLPFLCLLVISTVISFGVNAWNGYYGPPKVSAETSLRIASMGKQLSGIVADPVTDMLWNPARLSPESFLLFQLPNKLFTTFPGPKNTRWGLFLKGDYSSSTSESEDTGLPNPDYTSYINRSKSENSSKIYKGILLGSSKVSSNTCIGMRFKYESRPSQHISDYYHQSTYEYEYDDGSYRRLQTHESTNKNRRGNTFSSYSLRLGSFSELGNTDLEFFLKFDSQGDTSYNFSSYSSGNYREYERTYDSTTHINIDDDAYERLTDEGNGSKPRIFGCGIKLSRHFSPSSVLRAIGTFHIGSGNAKVDRRDRNYYLHEYSHSYSSPDTSYIIADTSESIDEEQDLLDGSERLIEGSFILGQELLITPQLLVGVGAKVYYYNSELRVEGTRDEIEDTSSSHTNIKEKDIHTDIDIYLPLGIEYKPIKPFSIRFGVTIYGKYDFSDRKTDGHYHSSKSTSGPDYTLNFGLGYNWRRFNISIYTYDITNIYSWNTEASYDF
ncbi:hypothetical protein KAW65_00565 [candidate division WOR-3 bacterium]|nr:hypothetical protein [candidate division WOR-3 bacterium]